MTDPAIPTITCHELHALAEREPITLIDVRTPEEFREVRASGARNVPLDVLEPARVMAERQGPKEAPVYLICHLGGRSGRACQMFMAAGFGNAVNVVGGTDEWESAGLPVERG